MEEDESSAFKPDSFWEEESNNVTQHVVVSSSIADRRKIGTISPSTSPSRDVPAISATANEAGDSTSIPNVHAQRMETGTVEGSTSQRDRAVPATTTAAAPPPAQQQEEGTKSTKATPQKGQAEMDEDEQTFVNEFGFEINPKEKHREEVYIKSIDGGQVLRREVKWANMTSDWSKASKKMNDKIKERCRKGIPSKLRGVAWQFLLGSRAEMEDPANSGVYEALKQKRMDVEVQGIIERDLGRTFPTHVLFRDTDGIGQTQLRSILRAYANIDPEVGYVQGMGFIVGTLMTQMEEEEAFWALHSLMHGERYRLRDMFRPGFPMLQLFFFQLKKLMEDHVPRLYKRFEEIGVDPSFFASQWFLTLFVYHFQFRALLRVWDIFFCEGWKQIFRVAIALMKWEEKTLLEMPFDRVLPALKLLHENKNPDEILTRSLRIKFKTDELLKWRKEYEAQLTAGASRHQR